MYRLQVLQRACTKLYSVARWCFKHFGWTFLGHAVGLAGWVRIGFLWVVRACKYKFGSLQFQRNICLAYNRGLGSCWIFSFLYGFNVIAVPKKCVTAQKKLFCNAYQGLDEHIVFTEGWQKGRNCWCLLQKGSAYLLLKQVSSEMVVADIVHGRYACYAFLDLFTITDHDAN